MHVPIAARRRRRRILGGRIESMFDSLPSAVPHLRAGTVRGIAVSGAERSPAFPTFRPWPSRDFRRPPAPTGSASPVRRAGGIQRAAACRDRPRAGDAGGARPVHRHERRARRRRRPDQQTQAFVLGEIERWARVIKKPARPRTKRNEEGKPFDQGRERPARGRLPRPRVAAGGAVLHHPPRASDDGNRAALHIVERLRARRAGHRA